MPNTKNFQVLLIGNGGREHALAYSIARSPSLEKLYAIQGNTGIAQHATCLDLDSNDHSAIVDFCQKQQIDLVVIGPEVPIVAGLADALENVSIRHFAPSAAAAQLEGSKNFARNFCTRHQIPQPHYSAFTESAEAKKHVKEHFPEGQCVIKADGLAAGKGVVIPHNQDDALKAIDKILGQNSLDASKPQILIEEKLSGVEASLFAMVDGTQAIFMGSAQDYKRAYDGDIGPNTGGMGAVSPAPHLTAALQEQAWQEIIIPTVKGMAEENTPYRGFLYAGLMLTDTGPQVIEFNCRFGDPEAQAILPRLKSDLLLAMIAATEGQLSRMQLKFTSHQAVTVVMTNRGYPHAHAKGDKIIGLVPQNAQTHIFHAGTAYDNEGNICANGGRVLAVTALADTIDKARNTAYAQTLTTHWKNCFCRHDIGQFDSE